MVLCSDKIRLELMIVPHLQLPESRRKDSEVIVNLFRECKTKIGQTKQGIETLRAGMERGVKAPLRGINPVKRD
jgi:hypothetical protein